MHNILLFASKRAEESDALLSSVVKKIVYFQFSDIEMNPSSIYDAALSQLHGNYQGLQDTLTILAREQSKIFEKVARIQNDFE